VPAEEVLLEGQHEQPREAQLTRVLDQPRDDGVPHPAAQHARVHRHGADLAEIGPQHVQRPAADDLTVDLGHEELLHGLVQGDDLLRQQYAARVPVDERLDHRHVSGSRPPHAHLGHAAE